MKHNIGRITCAWLGVAVFGAGQLASAQDSGPIVAARAVGAAPPAEVAGGGPRLPGLQPRNLPAKPGRTIVNPAIHDTSVLVVKFRDDLRVRVRNGLLTDEGTGHLAPAQGVLQRLMGASWQPSDRLTEARLDQLRANAQNNLGRAVADLNTQFNVKLPPGLSPAETCDALNVLEIVELATPMLKPMPLPLPPNYEPSQGYLGAPFGGINAQAVWNLPGGTGAGIKMADIEYSWNLAHQDLSPTTLLGPPPVDPFNDVCNGGTRNGLVCCPGGGACNNTTGLCVGGVNAGLQCCPGGICDESDNHGTAVLGEIGSLRNTWGTTGIAYQSTMYVVGANTSSGWDVGAAITQSLGTLGPGDVILIEQQIAGPNYTGIPPGTQFGLVPVEWYSPWYNRIVIAVGNGVIVVEAAGNGSQNLDDAIYGGWFAPGRDSGAIIVGAGAVPGGSDVDRSRLWFSNYGSTVDLQGWGEMVTTTGYGALYSAGGMNQWYTATFGGTSSASPIVAGACILLQSSYYALTGLELSPTQVRDTLRATGSPQQNGTFPATQNIGPRPDVLAARNMLPWCGDGIVQAGEECDDGNVINTDGCTNSCTLPRCGDGIVQTGEECDDGNAIDNDGCTNSCTLPAGGSSDSIVGWGYNGEGQTDVPAGAFTAVAAGWFHNLAIRSDGTLVGWGDNSYGEITVPSGTFKAVAAGYGHSLAIRTDGTLAGWGRNDFGQINVPAGTFTAIAAGRHQSLAIRNDGTLVGWGSNLYGETNVPAGTFTAVAGSTDHSLAIRSDGTLVGWGSNWAGQTNVPLGTFTAIAEGGFTSLAIRSDGTLAGWGCGDPANNWGQCNVPAGTFTAVDAGVYHSLAIRSDGTLVGWGRNDSGQTNVPAGTFTAVAGGAYHSLALKGGNPIAAWGLNDEGQTTVPSGTFTAVAAGWVHSLAIRSDGTLAGWGSNRYGEINVPAGTFTGVAAGGAVYDGAGFSLAIRSDGTLAGWGSNGSGQTDVPAGTFTAVAGGWYHSLAISSNGTLGGWGYNGFGQNDVPSGTFTAVAEGEFHSLAISSDGALAGWGWNGDGQTTVPAGTFTAVAAGRWHSLAIRSDGTLVGWGWNAYGQTAVPSGTFTAVAGGAYHSLAIRSDGTLAGWGRNDSGQSSVPTGTFIAVAGGGYHGLAIRTPQPPPPPGNIVWDSADTSPDRTTRSLRFRVEGKPNGSLEDAIKVTMVDLQNPQPPNAVCCPPQDFSAYEYGATCTDPGGCVRWVGKPGTFLEAQDIPTGASYPNFRTGDAKFGLF